MLYRIISMDSTAEVKPQMVPFFHGQQSTIVSLFPRDLKPGCGSSPVCSRSQSKRVGVTPTTGSSIWSVRRGSFCICYCSARHQWPFCCPVLVLPLPIMNGLGSKSRRSARPLSQLNCGSFLCRTTAFQTVFVAKEQCSAVGT